MKPAVLFIVLLTLVACSPQRSESQAEGSAPSFPQRIDLFQGGEFTGRLQINYNGDVIETVQLLNLENETEMLIEPVVLSDSLFRCRWLWREGVFDGEWRMVSPNRSFFSFSDNAPVRSIETEYDSLGRKQQVLFHFAEETIELAGFSYDGQSSAPLGCVTLDAGDYSRPGGRLVWRYDDAGRMISLVWTAAQSRRNWMARVEYRGEGATPPEIWTTLERCLWLPAPLFAEKAGL